MEYCSVYTDSLSEMPSAQQEPGKILCCQCGDLIEPNPSNMCVSCLRTQVDITDGIPKQGILQFCRACLRYLQPPTLWLRCPLESKELLSLCLKKLKTLNKVHLVDAGFVWTEPHSKRIKVKLTVQKEVFNGTILQQTFIVEFTIHNQMCTDCHKVEAKNYWKAVVQVRQKKSHKKTFYYLEQLILKHGAHASVLRIKQEHDGLDFFFATKQEARKLTDFLLSVVPCRYQATQKLITHDIHNNTYNYKYTFCVEIVPICKDDIVCLPPKLANSLGNLGNIAVCTRVTSQIQLIDPNTLQVGDLTGTQFWRQPFNSLCDLKQLTMYTVMEIEHMWRDRKPHAGECMISKKHVLADVWLVKSSELGMTDSMYHCRTHLGHLLKDGDQVLGLDFSCNNMTNEYLDKLSAKKLPEVVIVKKFLGEHAKRHKHRYWKLKHLSGELNDSTTNSDYVEFLEDLEDDIDYRKDIDIYMDRNRIPVTADESDEDDAPKISLAEMLEDLNIEDVDMIDHDSECVTTQD